MLHRGRRTERWPKHSQHPPRRARPPSRTQGVMGWLRDLTTDGDVEPNPGPGAFRALLGWWITHQVRGTQDHR
eukprot:4870054-Alexandrium_andersonii.AAC.1